MRLASTLPAAVAAALMMSAPAPAPAGDFDYLERINVRAESDPSGFRARLAARFDVGGTRLRTVMKAAEAPADAYMILKLSHLAGRSPGDVVEAYRAQRHGGWGRLAKRLGIKPGSRAFHALKRGGLDRGRGHPPGQGGHPGRGRGHGPK